ncbi:MAG: hypothetical protein KKD18_01280 [Nanoarchaeota archaeon]|nr:hypothetical protein [Nanoarchaeota archaeon]MBU0977026.1 hypothetical protein [Nanoarchaeota archaeon]
MNLGDYYINPEFTMFLAGLLVFLVVFSVLTRFKQFQKNRSVPFIISAIFAVYFVHRFKDMTYEILVYNSAIAIAAVAAILVLFVIIFRFLRKQF